MVCVCGVPSLQRQWDRAEARVSARPVPTPQIWGPRGLCIRQEAACRQGYGCCLPPSPAPKGRGGRTHLSSAAGR